MNAPQDWELGRIAHGQVEFGLAELMPDPEREACWLLSVDEVMQSYVDLADPAHLELVYTEWIARVIDLHWPAGAPLRAVHVGGGGFTVPRYLAALRPGSAQTVFEPDGRLVEFLRANLPGDPTAGARVLGIDGVRGVRDLPDADTDVLVLDAYVAGSGVSELAGVEFLTDAARVLRPGGACVANLWDRAELGFFRRALASAMAVFPQVAVLAQAGVLAGQRSGNLVLAASAEPLPVAALAAWGQADGRREFCLTAAQAVEVCGSGRPLTGPDPLDEPIPSIRVWG